jgi:hypothetical protein
MERSAIRDTSAGMPTSRREFRGMLAEPIFESGVVFKFRDLNAVDRRAGFANLLNLIGAHFPNPQHAMLLQAGMCQVDCALTQRSIDVAATDQNKINEITGKLQQ